MSAFVICYLIQKLLQTPPAVVAVVSNSGRLTFLKETARSQEWLVLRATNAHQTMSRGCSLQKIVNHPKLIGPST